ncbi:MAG: hypothetical protein FJ386_04820 [Verrucomicrobia bacterium]|nr:hypothetical protein [Verrucomicrobiota bacterium]
MHPTPRRALFATLAFTTALAARGSDWPQWRGPSRDGRAVGNALKLDALPREAKTLWTIAVGDGQASPVISGKQVIYLDDQGGQETVHCVNLADGKERWQVKFDQIESWRNTYGAGPRCTPLVDGDRVYVQSCRGEFRCLSIADGKTIWQTNFEKDWGVTFYGNSGNNHPAAKETAASRHGNNGSAVVDGDRIFVPVGSPTKGTLVAFNKMTGKVFWAAGTDFAAYSSVVVGNLAGVRQAVHLTADSLMGVDVETGKVLWKIPVKTGAKRHGFTPILAGDTVTIASWSVGMTRLKINKDSGGFTAEPMWKNDTVKPLLATPVLHGDFLFGLGSGTSKTELVCVDFKTGEVRWKQPGFGDYAAFIAVGDKILVQAQSGELLLMRANPEKFEELGRIQTCGNTWSHPALADSKLLQRDKAKLFAIELAQ